MLPGAMLTLALLVLGSEAEPREQQPPVGAGGVKVEAAQVVWSYDTGG
jgi:hypothetical protein